MPDCASSVSQQAAEINVWNQKIGADRFAALMAQGAEDNQANSRAWANYVLEMSKDHQTLKYLSSIGLLQAGQTGFTENQQSVTPVRTATGDAIVGGVGVSAEQVAANVALGGGVILASVTATLANIANALTALLPVLVTSSGGASTPSQTQAKPAEPAAPAAS